MSEGNETILVGMAVQLGVAAIAYMRARAADHKANSVTKRMDGLENGKGRKLIDQRLAVHNLIDPGAITQHGDTEEKERE